MLAETELAEYLAQIRTDVCARCPERPAGGPPCGPLGKDCGVEMHLPRLIATIHEVNSPLINPYLEQNRKQICESCAFLHSSICPCPMDYLAVLLVNAVETVDQRRGGRESSLSGSKADARTPVISRVYDEGAGTWTGCDWSTRFGLTGLDLNGWTASAAEARGRETAGLAAQDWTQAAHWLHCVELHARRAEAHAAMALKAARSGQLGQAREHAKQAWALEFATGRPIWCSSSPAWQKLWQVLEASPIPFGQPG